MKRFKNNPLGMFCLLLSFGAAALVAITVYGQSGNTIQGCYDNKSGVLRKVVSPSDCSHKETSINWNIIGPHGPQGPPGPAGSSHGSIMVHGIAAAPPGPFNIPVGGAVPVPYRFPRDGVIQRMRVLIASNSYDGPAVVTLLVNGNPTLLTTTIPAGSTADIDVPGTVNVLDGERVSMVLDTSAVSNGEIRLSVSYEIP